MIEPSPVRGDGGLSERDRVEFAIEAWKTTVDVQKHFNELQLSIRKVGITFGGAVLGAAALFYREDHQSYIPAIFVMVAVAAAMLFRVVDRHSYHRFLLSSVRHAAEVEEFLGRETKMMVGETPPTSVFSLSAAISRGSAISPGEVGWWLRLIAWFSKDKKIHSHHRLEILYRGFLAILLTVAAGLFYNAYDKRHPVQPTPQVQESALMRPDLACEPGQSAAPH
jgi:hypothetical protein